MRLIFITLIALTLYACHDNGIDPYNHATAELDGFYWSGQVEATHTPRFVCF